MAPLRALSIRQPYAEMILRGLKTVEYRSRPTRLIGERFYIYASKGGGAKTPSPESMKGIWSRDLTPARDQPPPAWLLEMWELLRRGSLPTGVIVGEAVIDRVTRRADDDVYEWHLGGVRRAAGELRKPARHPQPVWFRPF